MLLLRLANRPCARAGSGSPWAWRKSALVRRRSRTSSHLDLTSRVNIPSSNLPSTTYISIVGTAGSHISILMISLLATMILKHTYCRQWPCVLYRQRLTKQDKKIVGYVRQQHLGNIQNGATKSRRGLWNGLYYISFDRCLNDYTFPLLLYTSRLPCGMPFTF